MSDAARKRGVKYDENLFDVGTAASEGFGHDMGYSAVDIQTKEILRAKPIDIFSIKPNPMQPRRVVPSRYREGPVLEQIKRWLAEVERGTGRALPLMDVIKGEVELRTADGNGDFGAAPEELPLLRLADLAASIRQDGLTNPITVVKSGDEFLIETGERRWVAYHLLNGLVEGDAYAAIPARRMAELNLWRQASENTARDALNAIARARQIALLLMDLLGWDKFAPIESFGHEQDFYAQVADADRWRIPYGKSEQLCLACGFESASRIRQYRALLKLSREQWTYADDHDISEFEIRGWAPGKSVTAVTDSQKPADSSKIPGALKRLERHLTEAEFQMMDEAQQAGAIEWLRAQLKRLEDWHQSG